MKKKAVLCITLAFLFALTTIGCGNSKVQTTKEGTPETTLSEKTQETNGGTAETTTLSNTNETTSAESTAKESDIKPAKNATTQLEKTPAKKVPTKSKTTVPSKTNTIVKKAASTSTASKASTTTSTPTSTNSTQKAEKPSAENTTTVPETTQTTKPEASKTETVNYESFVGVYTVKVGLTSVNLTITYEGGILYAAIKKPFALVLKPGTTNTFTIPDEPGTVIEFQDDGKITYTTKGLTFTGTKQ